MISAATRWAMGTLLRVETESSSTDSAAAARDAFFAEVARLEGRLSRFRPDSDVSRVNRAAGGAPAAVSPDAFEAIARALDYARETGGAFDPVDGGGRAAVVLDAEARTVFLPRGASLDLGGIGKGFALDRALALARAIPELERVSADFGGQLLFWRRGAYPAPERIAVEDPRAPGRLLAEFEIRSNCSVSTSSQAERPGHIVDRRDGGIASRSASATVAAPSATEAEAWSTALFVAGEEGLARLKDRPGVKALLF
jgi:thiamine biosynthesis lipoprotein